MKVNIRGTLLLLTLTASMIWMAGCKKTSSASTINSVVVGTWNWTSERDITTVNGTVTRDTTKQWGNGNIWTYTAGGQYSNTIYDSVYQSGHYTIIGQGISYDGYYDSIITLTANSFVTLHTDTINMNPVSLYRQIFGFTR